MNSSLRRCWRGGGLRLTVGLLVVAGCASSQTHLDVPIDPTSGHAQHAPSDTVVTVTVHDLRWKIHADGTREAAFGVSMGDLQFSPPAPIIVRQRLEFELDRIAASHGATQKRAFACDLIRFDVRTDTSPLYWDVVATISLVLTESGRDSIRLSSTATQRTWTWPGASVIQQSVSLALDSLTTQLNARAKELAVAPTP